MYSPYGLEVSDSCLECKIRAGGYFCDFDSELVKAFEALKYATVFPKGAVLFVEGQSPRGVFMLWKCFVPTVMSVTRAAATSCKAASWRKTRTTQRDRHDENALLHERRFER